jgi:hypothetical protein
LIGTATESKVANMFLRILLSLLLFITVTLIHSRSAVIVSTDSMWSIYLAQSLIRDGDLVLDEYKDLAKQRKNYGLRKRKGELYSYFPVGTAIMATPFVWLYGQSPEIFSKIMPTNLAATVEDLNLPLQRAIASIFVAVTAIILFFICQSFVSVPLSFVLALIAAFATPLWSTASRGLWQHGPSALLISSSLLLILKTEKRPDLSGLVGALLAFAYIVRPTNAIAFLCVLIFFLAFRPRALISFFLSSAIIFVPFVACSYSYLNRIVPPYYMASRLKLGWHLSQAFAANLFSPNRGLLFLSPILLPAFIEIFTVLARALGNLKSLQHYSFQLLVAACFFGHLVGISLFPEWWGGHAFGARYMAETVPYLIIFMAIWLSQARITASVSAILALFLILSVYIHQQGATRQETFMWNVKPNNIDRNVGRVWDYQDLQFLR